jgi:hypothetical protein
MKKIMTGSVNSVEAAMTGPQAVLCSPWKYDTKIGSV